MTPATVPTFVRISCALVLATACSFAGCTRRSDLPQSLSDREYWSLIESLSEPAGSFSKPSPQRGVQPARPPKS